MELSPKQKMFVSEYLIDLNATQAAIRAGYSNKRADQIGFENLRKPEISAEIQKAMDARSKRSLVTQDMVIAGLLKEAQAEDNGSPSSRVSAWEKLGKHLGIFKEDNEQKTPTQFIFNHTTKEQVKK